MATDPQVDGAATWACPVCRGRRSADRYRVPTAVEGGPRSGAFRPSAELFGRTSGRVLRCLTCGHSSVADQLSAASLIDAYSGSADPVSLREEEGQVETARRALAHIEALVGVGRVVDLGCWTGSFLVAAKARGWQTLGIEASEWAGGRARDRGIEVFTRDLLDHGLDDGQADLVAMCDVLEHLVEPLRGLAVCARLLRPRGLLYLTVPNAGSALATALGRRWWSVLPMHLQYFTAHSLELALDLSGFDILEAGSHAKAFSARYYAERLGGYSSLAGAAAVGAVERLGLADRMVAPDFGDRLAVIARRRPGAPPARPSRPRRRARSSS